MKALVVDQRSTCRRLALDRHKAGRSVGNVARRTARCLSGSQRAHLRQDGAPIAELVGVPRRARRAAHTGETKGAAPAAYSSNRSLVPACPFGAIEASGACSGEPESRKRLTIG